MTIALSAEIAEALFPPGKPYLPSSIPAMCADGGAADATSASSEFLLADAAVTVV